MNQVLHTTIYRKYIPILFLVVVVVMSLVSVPTVFADCADPQTYDEAVACNTGSRGNINSITALLIRVTDLVNIFIPFLLGLGVFVIIWGTFNYVIHGAEEEKRAEGKQFILYGIIGLFIMMSIWGLVNALSNTFTFSKVTRPAPQLPCIPGAGAPGCP